MPAAPPCLVPNIDSIRALVDFPSSYSVIPFGVDAVDARLAGPGLRKGALHEAVAQSCALVDDAAATLFLAGIAARVAQQSGRPTLWASCRNDLYAPGLAEAGLVSANVIHAQPRDDAALLAIVEDAVRDGTPSAVIAEAGKVPMVATRRLQLTAADADIPVLLLRRRRKPNQDPLLEPSAAWTRWQIGSTPSERLAVAGVGRPRWSVELVRQRGGEPFSIILEGCDETGRLAVPAVSAYRTVEAAGTARHKAA